HSHFCLPAVCWGHLSFLHTTYFPSLETTNLLRTDWSQKVRHHFGGGEQIPREGKALEPSHPSVQAFTLACFRGPSGTGSAAAAKM
ncbi:hypothetical protein LEMLEM_LOCUS3856, partial [Lemmus lemmus]